MRWCSATRSAQATSSPVVHRWTRAASRVSTSDQLIAPAFSTSSPEVGVCMKSTPSWSVRPRGGRDVPTPNLQLPTPNSPLDNVWNSGKTCRIHPDWKLGIGSWEFTMGHRMKRSVVLVSAAGALVAAGLVVSLQVRQEREFRRLVAVGEQALDEDETFVDIEAFSGALALKNGSMLAYLKRGDTYRRRGEYAKALRDLREAVRLDPTAPQPIELLADVNGAMGRHERAVELYHQYLALDDRAARV